eukprot:TRINITY_DN3943_c0_g1_i3.p1 TRINITY_DN3943_c0_g1~~TRINITY_DN3943_c0_g1_i3.p1  ORF type:complete len:238 (-),score=52.43 TRINITY_DN3943_c0_g1_i3:249-962(-)
MRQSSDAHDGTNTLLRDGSGDGADMLVTPNASPRRTSVSPARHNADEMAAAQEAATVSGNASKTFTILENEATMTASDGRYLSARRTHLSSELREWKKAFIDRVGRAPTSTDIKKDTAMGAVHDEYEAIPGDVDSRLTLLEERDTARAQEEQHASKVAQDSKDQKKELTKKLNDWKAQFETDNGRKPKAADIEADPAISTVYADYMASSRPTTAASPRLPTSRPTLPSPPFTPTTWP